MRWPTRSSGRCARGGSLPRQASGAGSHRAFGPTPESAPPTASGPRAERVVGALPAGPKLFAAARRCQASPSQSPAQRTRHDDRHPDPEPPSADSRTSDCCPRLQRGPRLPPLRSRPAARAAPGVPRLRHRPHPDHQPGARDQGAHDRPAVQRRLRRPPARLAADGPRPVLRRRRASPSCRWACATRAACPTAAMRRRGRNARRCGSTASPG